MMTRRVCVCVPRRGRAVLVVAVLVWLGLLRASAEATQDLFFFTSTADIRKWDSTSNNDEVIYEDAELPEALDCNYCKEDGKVYWISQSSIRRGSPDGESESEFEAVITRDISHARGIAVDSVGNNIYFSQNTAAEGHGRLEVSTCDGLHRRVLRTGLLRAGPLALDITRGYLYYADGFTIRQMFTNGSNDVLHTESSAEITGLAVDISVDRLYWSYDGNIMYRNLPNGDPFQINASGTIPYGLAAGDSIVYWTQKKTDDRLGGIHSYSESGGYLPLHSNSMISPQDITSSPDVTPPQSGCAVNNGDCPAFCFTIPAPSGGITSQCGCSTGIVLTVEDGEIKCPIVPDQFLLFGRIISIEDKTSEIRQVSLDVPNPIDVALPIDIGGLGAYHLAYDQATHMVYWNEVDPPAIMRAPINLMDQETPFINTDISCVTGMAIDTFSRNLYWVDAGLDRIEVAYIGSDALDGFSDGRRARKVLFSDDILQSQSLILDLRRSFMYWTDKGTDKPRVERARLDGTERTVLFQAGDGNIKEPSFVTVDAHTGIVYWTDTESHNIFTFTPADSTLEEHPTLAQNVHGLAVSGDYLYLSDDASGAIRRLDKNSVSGTSKLVENVHGAQSVVAVNVSDHVATPCPSWHPDHGCSHLCLRSTTTEHVCACPDGFEFEQGSTQRCAEVLGSVFMALEGVGVTSYKRVVTPDHESWTPASTMAVLVKTLAVDVLNSQLYYISSEDGLIYRRAWNTTSLSVATESESIVSCCLETAEDLAVDWLGGNLYWSDSGRGIIEVSKLNGERRRILYAGLEQPSVIELDPRRSHIYFIPKDSKAIHRVNMDGTSNKSDIVCEGDGCGSPSSDIVAVTALSIDFDSSPAFNDRLRWFYSIRHSEFDDLVTNVGICDLNNLCSDLSFSEIFTAEALYSNLLSFKDKFYYKMPGGDFNTNYIERYPATTVVEPHENIIDLALAHPAKQPGSHICLSDQTCTGYDPLCLVQDDIHGTCHCPTNAFKVIETDTNGIERDSCTRADSFLLWATPTFIYYYPLPSNLSSPKMTSEPHALPIPHLGDVVAVTYDPTNESVLWMDGESELLRSVNVYGAELKTLGRFPSSVRPESMAMDWIGGQIFFTEATGYQIESASVRSDRGDNLTVGSVMSSYGQEGVVWPYQPMDVLFDERRQALLWHEEGRQIFNISLSNLNNSGSRNLLLPYNDKRSIAHLTFDPNPGFVYWWNEKEQSIEMFDIVTPNDVKTLVSDVRDVRGLTGNTLTSSSTSGSVKTSFIFWYDGIDQSFYRCDVTKKRENTDINCKELLLSWAMGGEMVEFTSFDRARRIKDKSYACLESSSSCDYLCIEDAGQAKCECPLFRESLSDGKCTDIECQLYHQSCEDGLECFPNTYACDEIAHCSNGFDELNCTCEDPNDLPCGPEDNGLCYPNTSRCDGHIMCPNSKTDEMICCNAELEFGCYTLEANVYQCFQKQLKCDNVQHCQNMSDEMDCDQTPSPTPPPSGSVKAGLVAIIAASVIIFAAAMILVVIVITSIRCIHKHKARRRIRLPTISKASSSPPPQSDRSSLYSGLTSLGTESTNFGNCSSPHTDSFGKPMGFHTDPSNHISNPPPSLITGRPSQVLEEEAQSFNRSYAQSYAQSFALSEADPCPPPNPSVDWENMSALSISASQKGMRLANMNGNGRDHYHPPTVPGNPLHYQHHHHPMAVGFRGHPYRGNGHPYSNHGGGIPGISGGPGGGRRLQGHYPPSALSHLRSREAGNYDTAETETVFSQSTMNTENESQSVFAYDDCTPPGRPPSPATITEYSERRIPPSRISEYTDEDLQD